MKVKNLKIRLLTLASFVLLLGTHSAQAIDWNSWAAQIAANKELMYGALAAGAMGGAVYYEYSSSAALKNNAMTLNKENEKLTNFYHIFFNLMQDLRTARQLNLSYEKSKEKLLSFRDRFKLKDFTENSQMGGILTGALDALVFMGREFFSREKYSDKLLTKSICKANAVIEIIDQNVRDINDEKKKLGLGYHQNTGIKTFLIGGCESTKHLSSKKSARSIYQFREELRQYFGPDGKLNDKFLRLFGIEKFVNE